MSVNSYERAKLNHLMNEYNKAFMKPTWNDVNRKASRLAQGSNEQLQEYVFIEEMGEAIKEISKQKRYNNNKTQLLEETIDVIVSGLVLLNTLDPNNNYNHTEAAMNKLTIALERFGIKDER